MSQYMSDFDALQEDVGTVWQPQVTEESRSNCFLVFKWHHTLFVLLPHDGAEAYCVAQIEIISRYIGSSVALAPSCWTKRMCGETIKGSVCFLCHFSTARKQKKDAPRFTDYGGLWLPNDSSFLFLPHIPRQITRSDLLLERDTFSAYNSPFPI